jgi:hypothetical protein
MLQRIGPSLEFCGLESCMNQCLLHGIECVGIQWCEVGCELLRYTSEYGDGAFLFFSESWHVHDRDLFCDRPNPASPRDHLVTSCTTHTASTVSTSTITDVVHCNGPDALSCPGLVHLCNSTEVLVATNVGDACTVLGLCVCKLAFRCGV